MPRKKSPPLPLYRNLAVSFSALTALLIVTILYFSLVRATIVVTPRVETFPFAATLSVAREPAGGSTALPGSVFARDVTKQQTFSASLLREEDKKAGGKVRIVNTTGNPQTLVATTRFLSPEKALFRLQDTVVVPARGSIEGTIAADVAGKEGEIGPARFAIPGLRQELQSKIYGESSLPMSGGRRAVYRLTQADIDAGRSALLKAIEDEARSTAGAGIAGDPFVLLTVEPTASALDQKLGAETKMFALTVTARVRGAAIAERALADWIATQMKTALPDDERLLPFALSSVTTTIAAHNPEEGTTRLLVRAEGKSVVRVGSPIFDRSRFVGRTPKEVESLLAAHPRVASVRVALSPFFTKRLPRLSDHIRVEVREP